MAKIKEIHINRPNCPLTRPRLCNYTIKSSEKQFTLDISYPVEPELLEEI